MSQENVEIVRRPIRAPGRSHRALDERLGLRFPRLRVRIAHAVLRLPTRSRIRRALLSRSVQLATDASNRGDHAAAFMSYRSDAELVAPGGVVTLGSFPERLRGREERIRFEQAWREGWGEFRYQPEELIDMKDQILVLGRMVGSGPRSGASSESEWADLLTLSGGQVIREQVFFNRAEALKAVGLEG
jgi:ketosteroid isomerase-like protein